MEERAHLSSRDTVPRVTTLIVGFDSAWTPNNTGAIVGVFRSADGTIRELGSPQRANFVQAERTILSWQASEDPKKPLVLLDQPTFVRNATGQRPVENLVASPVGLRYGGMQPANTAKVEMFGESAPVWRFLERFGGPADPAHPMARTMVFETYPVLTMIALDWILPHSARLAGRLPNYNPKRRKTFALTDRRHVCRMACATLEEHRLIELTQWAKYASEMSNPHKSDQDALDACICLLVGLHMVQSRKCILVGDQQTGCIIVPFNEALHEDLPARCITTGRDCDKWVKRLRLQ
jgi:predicted RNase H-like nuclease